MPLHHRPSGSAGRGTQGGPARHRGSSAASPGRDAPPTDRPDPALDNTDRLLADLIAANTEFNKVSAEKDKVSAEREKLKALYDNAMKKLSETNRAMHDLKEQTKVFKEDNQNLRERCQRFRDDHDKMNYANLEWEKKYTELKAKFDNLSLRYNATSAPSPTNPMAGPLPERPKATRTTSKRESREQREDRGRARDREKREQKEQKAEKERLSRRFEDRRPPTNHRNSFIEGWGPGGRGRSASANPTSRAFTNVATGRMQGPAFTPSQQAAYSNVPRTTNQPMSPGLYSSSGSSAAVYDDDYEDGNYHPYPIVR